MTVRIGLAIGRDGVRAVMTRGPRAVWAGEMPLGSNEELQTTISALLATAPRPRWSRPVVQAAIGPHGAQTRRVVGLPELADEDALAAVVREAIGTYFLKNGVPLLTTHVRPLDPGAVMVAAIDRPYVDAIRAACKARGWRIGPIAPTAVALTHSISEPQFHWTDGALTMEISRTDAGTLEAVRTRPTRAKDANEAPLSPVPALASLGAEAVRFADAFGAAAIDPHEPLVIRPDAPELGSRMWPRGTIIRASALLLLGAAAIGLSPFGAQWAGTRARARVNQVRPGRWQVVSTSLQQLDRVSAILHQARAFADSRTSLSTFLGELGRSLPDHSAVLEFEWRDPRGAITVVTTNPTAVLAAVRRLPGVTTVALVGSVSRQSVAGQDLQRVTIQFVMSANR